jgi:hypothetical protein
MRNGPADREQAHEVVQSVDFTLRVALGESFRR